MANNGRKKKKKVKHANPIVYTRKEVKPEEVMKIRSAEITMSAVAPKQYPEEGLPEVAFAGRSNVGKSSIINALLNKRKFARISSTPGKTRTINFYLINEEFYFVDLPGYGYARISKTEKEKWGDIMQLYLEERGPLCSILLLVDVRHEPSEEDKHMYDWIKFFGYNCIVVATKADKISKGQYQKHEKIIREKLGVYPEDKVILTSSAKKTGIEKLWNAIVDEYTNHGYEINYEKTILEVSK